MYILDPVHYKEKWEEIPHVKKKKSSLVDRIILQKSLETRPSADGGSATWH
jgi:hypothetical protein